MVTANEAVADLQNKVAIAAGPFVYCLEGCDNEGVADLRLDTRAPLSMTFEKELLNGVNVIKGQALDKTGKKVSVSAIPYYALGNRQDKGDSHACFVLFGIAFVYTPDQSGCK